SRWRSARRCCRWSGRSPAAEGSGRARALRITSHRPAARGRPTGPYGADEGSPPRAAGLRSWRKLPGGFALGAVLVPLVDDEVEVLEVALLVEGQGAGGGVEGVGAQRGGDLLGVGATGLFDALGDHLHGGVGREHERTARV